MYAMEQVQVPPPQAAAYLSTCTPHRPGCRYHIRYDDFIDICKRDVACGDALRYFEMRTNWRIEQLRQEYHMPQGVWPADEDLWIDASVRQIERGTLRAQGKSTYALVLSEEPKDEESATLVSLGYLKRRIIARRGTEEPETPAAVRYRDVIGEYIHVLDARGNYIGDDGAQHNAICEGYTQVVWQYLYCIEAINAAIAALDWLAPPEPLRRFAPQLRRSDEIKKSSVPATTKSNSAGHTAHGEKASLGEGTLGKNASSEFQYNSDEEGVSTTYDLATLRTAAWNEDTLIGLSSAVLKVPDREKCDEDVWQREWAGPASRLIELTAQLSPERAWERIDLVMRYMATPGSPSWWQQPYDPKRPRAARRKKTPITLRHIADNFETQYADSQANTWYPETLTSYDGLPLVEEETSTGYEAGYRSTQRSEDIDNEFPVHETETVFDELSTGKGGTLPAGVGVSKEDLDALNGRVLEEYPELRCSLGRDEIAPGLYVLGIEHAPDCWLTFYNAQDWEDIDPERLLIIEQQAVPYGETLLRSITQGPPDADESNMEREGGSP